MSFVEKKLHSVRKLLGTTLHLVIHKKVKLIHDFIVYLMRLSLRGKFRAIKYKVDVVKVTFVVLYGHKINCSNSKSYLGANISNF